MSRRNQRSAKPLKKISCYFFSRFNVENETDFNIESAYNGVYPKHNKKKELRKSKKTTLKLYSESMKLSTISWFNNEKTKEISYEYVKKFYIFQAMKQFLILALEKPNTPSSRCYFVLRVPSLNNILMICDRVESNNAHNATDETVEQLRIENLNNPNREIEHDEDPISYDTDHGAVSESEIVPVAKARKTNLMPNFQQNESDERIFTDSGSDSSSDKNFEIAPAAQWKEETKFISYRPSVGNFVDDNGSVYLYTAQQITPDYSNIYSSSLFSVSDESSDEESVVMNGRANHHHQENGSYKYTQSSSGKNEISYYF